MKKPPRNIRPANPSVKTPRRMSPSQCFFIVIVITLLALSSASQPTSAQQRGRSSSGGNRARPTAKAQAQESERARRAKALTLLSETAEEARNLDDLFYRARLQALAADALWPFDAQRARIIFRRAWEAATAADKAEREAEIVDAGTTPDEVGPFTEARDEVLAKTAARDAALANVFLSDLLKEPSGENNPEQDATTTARKTLWPVPSKMGERRLALAYQLLAGDEFESAMRIVAPVVAEGQSLPLMTFMLRLHERNTAAGEALYSAMVTHMLRSTEADANTVLLLSTPIVSPELIVGVDESGALQFIPVRRENPRSGPQPIMQTTRGQFFKAAASVLLRSPRPGAIEIQDKAARYFAIGRLLPHFEREAPQHAAELQARANAILNEFAENRREALSSQLGLRTLGAPASTDPLRSHFDELARTGEQAERDRITTRIVLIATRNRAWDRARRAAAELSDEGTRRAANSFIALHQIADIANAYKDEKDDDYESIVTFLKGADVPPVASAWGYAQAARVAARQKERQRVVELLTEAEHYAERTDANTSQRVAAYGVIATEAARLDQQRAWELLTQLVKAANALEDFAGDEVSIEFRPDENSAPTSETPFTFTADVFRLDTIFATMAHLDFERAMTSARALQGDVPRAFAQLAIARAALVKK